MVSLQHQQAIDRQRRIIFQDDVLANDAFRSEEIGPARLAKLVDFYMSRLDAGPNQIDSVWHEWGEGNTAVWPSEVLPRTENVFPQWWAAGIDPVQVLLDENRKRAREVFFSYRINGSDNDDLFDPPHPFEEPIPLKAEHPDWLIRKWHPYWNFGFQGVRDLKLAAVREVAELYDYDGIAIDFARVPVLFPEGQQWEHRDLLTDFMRQVRTALLEIGTRRRRPCLLAARVPEDLAGCHFDGIDVETWVRKAIIDLLVIGARTARADVAGFRELTSGTEIKVYPSWDDHHSSDGYRHPALEVWRGVCANWWHHKPDGMHTFNLMFPSPECERKLGITPAPHYRGGSWDPAASQTAWDTQRHVFNEIGSPETLTRRDKVFFVERRGGGHGPDFTPAPDDWYTPRHAYFQTNMLAPLPEELVDDGSADTLLTLDVADDVNALAESIESLILRLAFSRDPGKARGDDSEESALQVDVRVNNLPLGVPSRATETATPLNAQFEHWLAFEVPPLFLAVGANLIGVRKSAADEVLVRIEKLELHLHYR